MQIYFKTRQQARNFAAKSKQGKVKDNGITTTNRWSVELIKTINKMEK